MGGTVYSVAGFCLVTGLFRHKAGRYRTKFMVKKSVFVFALALGFGLSAQAALLFNTNATWKYFKGRSEASSPDTTAWRRLDFDDSAFTVGATPFWYGDVLPGGTQLTDMLNSYSTIFIRRTF